MPWPVQRRSWEAALAHETSKQATRRSADRRYATRWLKGEGIDIGCGEDSLAALASFFPLMTSVRSWDLPDGDAMLMQGVPDRSFDFVHSSHCLEHLVDPYLSMANWIRICRAGGHLVITVPDEDLYEQGVWPSTFNADHKWTFTIGKATSWSPKSVNIFDLVGRFLSEVEVLKVELLDAGFQYGKPRHDQSWGVLSESAIEIVLRKKDSGAGDGARQIADPQETFALALSLQQEGRGAEAATLYRQLLALHPDDAASLNNLSRLVDEVEADVLLSRATALRPDVPDAHWSRGLLLQGRGDMAGAAECFQAVTALMPHHAAAFHALGRCLQAEDRFAEALRATERAIELDPGLVDAHVRRGSIHAALCRFEEAAEAFDVAIALAPAHALAHVLRGHLDLRAGRLREGAEALQWIWKGRGFEDQSGLFGSESPDGDDLHGQVILLSADSGLGDTLQFVRYADILKARGASVIVECQPELVRLLDQSEGIDDVLPVGGPLPSFSHRVPLHNLLCAFGTTVETIPAACPYVKAPPSDVAAWAERLDAYRGLKVGLVWGGNAGHAADRRRSVPPFMLEPLMAIEGVTFVSLQKDRPSPGLRLVDWTMDLEDFAATAALIQCLDLVVTVDSAVAHLAGALGRPVWLLNRFDACWRWLRDRTDSPWYPSLRQFRQTAPGDWQSVVASVASDLADLAAAQDARAVRKTPARAPKRARPLARVA